MLSPKFFFGILRMDTKENFIITDKIDKPMKELEELNTVVRRKKAEIRKAMFFAKHPELLKAKQVADTIAQVKADEVKVKEEGVPAPEPKREVKEPVRQTAPEPKVIEIKDNVPTSATFKPISAQIPAFVQAPAPQHVRAPTIVGLNSKWF